MPLKFALSKHILIYDYLSCEHGIMELVGTEPFWLRAIGGTHAYDWEKQVPRV